MHISFELPESILYCVLSSCVTVVPNDLQTRVFTASCLSSQNNSDAIVCLFWFALFKRCALVESSCKRSSPGATHVARTHQIASNKVERKSTLEIAQLIHRIPSSARMSPANRLSPLFRHNEASQFRDRGRYREVQGRGRVALLPHSLPVNISLTLRKRNPAGSQRPEALASREQPLACFPPEFPHSAPPLDGSEGR